MIRRDDPDPLLADALEAYRAAACAEADAYFDEHALEVQRQHILERLAQAGQPARVLHFPGAPAPYRPAAGISRRWISAAAAAGLLVGLITGQLLHVMPGDAWVHRVAPRHPQSVPVGRMVALPALATTTDADNALLDAIDVAVTSRGASDLRAFDDLTFAYEPR
jgi:hypothetical protein